MESSKSHVDANVAPFPPRGTAGVRRVAPIAGIVVFALGAVQLIGWLLRVRWLLVPAPGLSTMPASAAVAFMLAGASLLLAFRDDVRAPLRMAPAAALWVLAFAYLVEILTGLDLGLHQNPLAIHAWLADPNPSSGAMRPMEAAAFLGFATAVLLVTQSKIRAEAALHTLVLFTMFVGLVGAIGEPSGLDRIIGRSLAPIFSVGLGLFASAIGLQGLLARRGSRPGVRDITNRAGLIAGAIVLLAGSGGLLGGFAALLPITSAALGDGLQSALLDRARLINMTVEQAWATSHGYANQPPRLDAMRRLDRNPADAEARALMAGAAAGARACGFSAVRFRSTAGRVVAEDGVFTTRALLSTPVRTPDPASLVWNHALSLRVSIPMVVEGRTIGTLDAERPLPLDHALTDRGAFGDTLDFALCAHAGPGQMNCFPFRSTGGRVLRALPERFGGALIPAAHALAGRTGLVHTPDYRGREVIAAYAPVGTLGLGAVLKIDASQLYGPITHRLRVLMWLIPLLGLAAVLVLRLQTMPLAGRLADEIRQRRDAENKLERSRAELAKLAAHIAEGVFMVDAAARVTFVNPEAQRMLGWSAEELLGHDCQDRFRVRRLEGTPAAGNRPLVRRAIEEGQVVRGACEWLVRKDGTMFPVSIVAAPVVEGGRVKGAVVSFEDISERQQADLAQRRLTRALRMVSECNAALVRATDERALLQEICEIVTRAGSYLLAWVGFPVNDAARTVRVAAHAGPMGGYLDLMDVSWGDAPNGRGPTGRALREHTLQVTHDLVRDENFEPWREVARRFHLDASIALPLPCGKDSYGALTVYAQGDDAFSADEVELLEQLAGDLAYGIAALRNELARQNAVNEHLAAEERYRSVLDNAADAVFVYDAAGPIHYANQQAADILGWSVEQLGRMDMRDLVARDAVDTVRTLARRLGVNGHLRAEATLQRRDGSALSVEVNAVRLPDGNFYAAFRDISERKAIEARMEHVATHDPLTGLANRNLLLDRIDQALIHGQRAGHVVAAMLLDLDRFKVINDSLTHATGDAVLTEVAHRLRDAVRAGDTVARLGGDEFMIVATELRSEDDATTLARKILSAVSRPLNADGHELVITGSLGIAVFPRDGEDPDTLMRNADLAMYRAKEVSRDAFAFYAPEMNARMRRRLEIENGLRRALELSEFALHYQPKVDLRTGRMVGAEALLRWRRPDASLVSPADFIPLAEETGLIVEIGAWVIDHVCARQRMWADAGLKLCPVAVNVSARQFQQEGLADHVSQALRRHALDAHLLQLEVTETAIMLNPERTLAVLRDLKRIGVHISLDDFGSGYSSLNYLRRFPIDSIKVDQSFVRDISVDPDDASIVRLIIALGHDLDQTVIAEGVETPEQLHFLRRHHCDQMQGYLFSKPLPEEAFEAMLRAPRMLLLEADHTRVENA